MGGKKKVTVGYRYYMGLHLGICHGPVDAVTAITVDKRLAWSGSITDNGSSFINQPQLFGGDDREGGVAGFFDVLMGGPAQARNDYLEAKLGADIPAYRGILSLVFRQGLISANNPYVKPWAVRVRRILQGWGADGCWYPEKAQIGFVESAEQVRTWTPRANGFESNMIRDVAYANGVFVAVGDGGKIQRSFDGATWVDAIVSIPNGHLVHAVAAGVGVFIAAADGGYIYRSIDNGASWQQIAAPAPAAAYSVHYANGVFIIGVQNAYIWRSEDGGATWTQIHTGILNGAQCESIHFADGKWVLGWALGMMCVSTDNGVTWNYPTSEPFGATDVVLDIGYANGLWVASAAFGKIATSVDALTWTQRTSGLETTEPLHISALAYGDGIWIASNANDMVTSVDGITWSPWAGSSDNYPIVSLIYAAGKFVGVGSSGTIISSAKQVTPATYPGMNPAHIIYQCLTNAEWGMGYPRSAIHDANFRAAADTFYAEAFGLSMIWNQQESIEGFVQIVLDHVGAMMALDEATGQFLLIPIRADYNVNALPVYGVDEIGTLDSYQRAAWGETINEITVVYTDAETNKDVPVTVQDLANIRAQGAVVNATKKYPGLRSFTLAARVALRDLLSRSTPLAKVRFRANRKLYDLRPGAVFKLDWPSLGIDDVVFRVLSVNRGTIADNMIEVQAAEDVFGLPTASYVAQQPPGWTNPVSEPLAAPYRKIYERTYYELAAGLTAAELAAVANDAGYLSTLAVRPSSDAYGYDLDVYAGGAYEVKASGAFCPSCTIMADITPTQAVCTIGSGVDLDLVELGSWAYIENEIVSVTALNTGAGTVTLGRGCLDTVAKAHGAGARIFFAGTFSAEDPTEYLVGQSGIVKMLTRTGQGRLDEDEAPVDSTTMARRQYRPYPPGLFRLTGSQGTIPSTAYPTEVRGDLVVSWAHRNRLTQNLETESAGNIGPEAGVTYNLRIYDTGLNQLVESQTGITGTSFASALRGIRTLRVELESQRSGYASVQMHSHTFLFYNPGRILTEAGDQLATEDSNTIIKE